MEVKNRFAILKNFNKQPDDLWNNIKQNVLVAVEERLHKVTRKKRITWLSEQAVQLAEKPRKIKVLEHHSEKYKQFTAELRRKARKDEEKYLRDECKEMKNHSIGGKPKDFFKKIKEITGKYTAKGGTIKRADGEDLTEDALIKQRWQE